MTTANLDSLLEKVRSLETKGDLAGAVTALQGAPEPMKDRGLWNYARGSLAFRQGDLDSAQQFIEKAIEAEPEIAEYRSNLGAVLLERARKGDAAAGPKALEVMKAGMRWGATLPDTYVNYGLALMLAGRNEEALKACDDALALDAGHVTARYNRAAALNAMGRHDEALATVELVLKAQPAHAQALASKKRLLEKLGRA